MNKPVEIAELDYTPFPGIEKFEKAITDVIASLEAISLILKDPSIAQHLNEED